MIGGKLYVVGGGFPSAASADLDVYDPAANTWKTLAPIPTAGPAIGAAISGNLFVITRGGRVGEWPSYEYTPSTNVWKARAGPALEHDGVVRVTLDGKSYLLAVGGGHNGFDDNPDVFGFFPNASELYTRLPFCRSESRSSLLPETVARISDLSSRITHGVRG